MAEQFPEHEFLTWLKHPTLFIESYRLVWNKKFLKADGDELHYYPIGEDLSARSQGKL